MRPIRLLLVAAVVFATIALAGCGRGGSARDAATPTTAAATPATSATGSANLGAKPGSEAAVAAARDFLRNEVGMGELVAGPFKATGADTGQVSFRLKFGEGGQPMPAGAPQTVVRLQRYRDGWAVAGTSSRNIQVSEPVRFARIASPVTVAGKASAFEGTVQVAVTEDRAGKDRAIGHGVVTGNGTEELGPFKGRIGFTRPTAGAGWLLFTTESEADGVGVLETTALRIRFQVAVAAPLITGVTSTPALIPSAFALELPKGSGTAVVRVKATDTSKVRFLLTPTGTGTASLAKLLGEDADGSNGWALRWSYADQPLLGHITIRAIGPGGSAEKLLGVHHPDPNE
jgi:hypothetical protein